MFAWKVSTHVTSSRLLLCMFFFFSTRNHIRTIMLKLRKRERARESERASAREQSCARGKEEWVFSYSLTRPSSCSAQWTHRHTREHTSAQKTEAESRGLAATWLGYGTRFWQQRCKLHQVSISRQQAGKRATSHFQLGKRGRDEFCRRVSSKDAS